MNSAAKVKLIDFDSAQQLKDAEQTMYRLAGNLAAVSPERAERLPCQFLPEDCFMLGWTFRTLICQAPRDPTEATQLWARVKPLLERANIRPKMKEVLLRCSHPVVPEVGPPPLPTHPSPTLLTSTPAGNPLTKLWGIC